MKCPTCNLTARVLETRKRGTSIYRRYQCLTTNCRLRFSTLESVINPTGPSSTPGGTAPSTSTEPLADAETSTSMEMLHGERA